MQFEPLHEPNSSVFNTVAYLKGYNRFPEDWLRNSNDVSTYPGIINAISSYGVTPEANQPFVQVGDIPNDNFGKEMQTIIISRMKGKRFGILMVEWLDVTGYVMAVEHDDISGWLAVYDPSNGVYL